MLIDDVRSGAIKIGFADRAVSAEWINDDFAQRLYAMCIGDCAVVRSSNVYDYLCGLFGYENGKSDKKIRDVAINVSPPFPDMWFEFKNLHHTFGVCLRSALLDDLDQVTRQQAIKKYLTDLDDEPPKWVVLADIFAHLPPRDLMAYVGRCAYLVGESGRLGYKQLMHEATDTYNADIMYFTVEVVLLTLTFMHCKNVRRVENQPSSALQKARQRKGKPPLVKHYTLEINPMKEILRKEGRVESEGIARALHICRGHFANYTEDKPLFGKIVGTVWVPAHVRGSREAGLVKKDYSNKL